MIIGWMGEKSTSILTAVLRHRQRSFTTSSRRPRNLLARYAPPPPEPPRELFETISTIPVSASIQEVPSPSMFGSTASLGNSYAGAQQGFQGRRLATPLPAMLPLSEAQETQKKALKPIEDTGMTVHGVHIPPKPIPPGEEECCMSGCVNCVYNMYADDTLAYNEALSSALSALESAQIPRFEWPAPILALDRKKRSKRVDESSNAQDATDEEVADIMDAMDPGLKAFLELEGKLKSKKKRALATTL